MRNARTMWKVLVWVWIVLVLPFAWVSIQVIEQLSRKGFPQNLYDTTLGFLFLPGWPIVLTSSVLGALLLATIITGIIVLRSKEDEQVPVPAPLESTTITNTIDNNQGAASQIGSTGSAMIIQNSPGASIHFPHPAIDTHTLTAERQKTLLHRYLNSVISKNKDLNPTGIHQSQALLSVNVPLDEIFIHIRAVSERPSLISVLSSKNCWKKSSRCAAALTSTRTSEKSMSRVASCHVAFPTGRRVATGAPEQRGQN